MSLLPELPTRMSGRASSVHVSDPHLQRTISSRNIYRQTERSVAIAEQEPARAALVVHHDEIEMPIAPPAPDPAPPLGEVCAVASEPPEQPCAANGTHAVASASQNARRLAVR